MLYRVLFLLHLLLGAILEDPFDNVGFGRGTLNMMALIELGPESVKVLKLNQMPDLGERGVNYRRFGNGGGGGDTACHVE